MTESSMTQQSSPRTQDEYTRAYPDHLVTQCMNIRRDDVLDKRIRYTFERRRGPYRPVTLGVYLADTFAEALEKHLFAEAEKAKAEAAKEAKRNEERA